MDVMDLLKKEVLIFAPFFLLFFIVSIFSATAKNSLNGTTFLPALFFLHLLSWTIVYAIARFLVKCAKIFKK